MTRHKLRLVAAPILLALIAAALVAIGSTGEGAPAPSARDDRDRLAAAYFALPLSFEANPGRYDFASRGAGYSLLVDGNEALLGLAADDKQQAQVRMRLVGGDANAKARGLDELPGKVNYFLGSDPSRWRTGVTTYRRVGFRDVYDGVDIDYYGNQRRLEYDLKVSPGADPSQVGLRFEGAETVDVTDGGEVLLETSAGVIRQLPPVAYQEGGDGARQKVESRYVLERDGDIGFALGRYDASREVVIDPVLEYSTFLGGTDEDFADDIAVDSLGSAYVTGRTASPSTGTPATGPTSPRFPTTTGAFDTTYGTSGTNGNVDAFVTKFNADGSLLTYSTYLGGGARDVGEGIAVDSLGNAYVTGRTESGSTGNPATGPTSPRFPTTTGAFDTVYGSNGTDGSADGFVTKLDATGSALVYSAYLGGKEEDFGEDVVVDSANSAYVTGRTKSISSGTQAERFPLVSGSFDTSYSSGFEGFATKVDPTGASLVYSTYLGASGDDFGEGIALDATNNAYVTGRTSSTNFPLASALDNSHNGGDDAFVTKLNPGGTAPVYSTFLGGSAADAGNDVAVDTASSAYVTGETSSTGFPTTSAFDNTHSGNVDVFVTKYNPAGSSHTYSTFLGGTSSEFGTGISVDSSGRAYVTGRTLSGSTGTPATGPTSPRFPTTTGAFDTTYGTDGTNGNGDAFLTSLSANGSSLVHSTFLGGIGSDLGEGVALDSSGCAYVTGQTHSDNPDYPTTAGAFDTIYTSTDDGDAFVSKFCDTAQLSGQKFRDRNGNGTDDGAGDEGLADWRIYVDLNGDGDRDANEPFDDTDSSGDYTIINIPPGGPYDIREELQTGWQCTHPANDCSHDDVTFASGEHKSSGFDFGNFQLAKKSGTKFNDLNGNGSRDSGEPGLGGWQIYVDYDNDGAHQQGEPEATTGQDGSYTITGITGGTYKVRETNQPGWTCTHPSPDCFHTETFASGDDKTGNDFGNFRTPGPDQGGQPPNQPEIEVEDEAAESDPEGDQGDVGGEGKRSRGRRDRDRDDLPFTGLALAALVLVGLLLLSGGFVLRRRGRAA